MRPWWRTALLLSAHVVVASVLGLTVLLFASPRALVHFWTDSMAADAVVVLGVGGAACATYALTRRDRPALGMLVGALAAWLAFGVAVALVDGGPLGTRVFQGLQYALLAFPGIVYAATAPWALARRDEARLAAGR